MTNQTPLYQHAELKVFNFGKISSKPAVQQLFNSSYFVIVMVNSGTLNFHGNDTEYCLTTNELLVIPVRASCEIVWISDVLVISSVSFTPGFIFKNTIRKPNIGFFEFFITKSPSKITLSDDDASLLMDLFILAENTNLKTKSYAFYNELLLLSFNILLYAIASLYSSDSRHVKDKHTRQEKLVFQFLELLEENCKKEHSIRFYAETLFISRGHLSKTVQLVTGKTVKQFIEEALIVEAKILLQDDDLTITQITEELHFGNPSSFSHFFRKSTSISPSEYRLKLNLNNA